MLHRKDDWDKALEENNKDNPKSAPVFYTSLAEYGATLNIKLSDITKSLVNGGGSQLLVNRPILFRGSDPYQRQQNKSARALLDCAGGK
jgi:hypothetical protein